MTLCDPSVTLRDPSVTHILGHRGSQGVTGGSRRGHGGVTAGSQGHEGSQRGHGGSQGRDLCRGCYAPWSLERAVSSHRAESIDLLPRSIDCLLTHLSLLPVLTVAAVSPPLPSTHYTHTTGTAVLPLLHSLACMEAGCIAPCRGATDRSLGVGHMVGVRGWGQSWALPVTVLSTNLPSIAHSYTDIAAAAPPSVKNGGWHRSLGRRGTSPESARCQHCGYVRPR